MKYPEFYWLNEKSIAFLRNGYLNKDEDPIQRIRDIAQRAEDILQVKGFADKFFLYMSRGWYSLASPIWANFGRVRGLPISCNGSYVADTLCSILGKVSEIGMMSKHGSGTSVYLGELRPRGASTSDGGMTSGPAHFAELYDTVAEVVSQSGVRRGNCAAYLPIEHPDILEFLQIRSEGHAIQQLSIGITVTDAWMQSMIDGDADKRKIWAKVLSKRSETGYPYIFFTDTVNNGAPQIYKDKGMKIYASNLCSEIALSSSEEESFVCDLSSMNLLHEEEWRKTDAVETMGFFLDAVMSEYIEKVKDIPYMRPAYNFAVNQRALGIGVLGWHSLLQSRSIAFESMEAKMLNVSIHAFMKERGEVATKQMAVLYGEPPLLKGTGRRNVTLFATAPTTSSSFVLGQVSKSREPYDSNYFVQDLAKGKFTFKNPALKEVLKAHNQDNRDTWKSILGRGGSVQHLDFLTDHEKEVFKTFGEISQKEIVIQAAAAQKYIDQSISLNLMIPPKTPVKEINALIIFAWKSGVKTLYYQRSANPSQELSRNILACKSCEG